VRGCSGYLGREGPRQKVVKTRLGLSHRRTFEYSRYEFLLCTCSVLSGRAQGLYLGRNNDIVRTPYYLSQGLYSPTTSYKIDQYRIDSIDCPSIGFYWTYVSYPSTADIGLILQWFLAYPQTLQLLYRPYNLMTHDLRTKLLSTMADARFPKR
jgi:hypothetical protein